MAKTAMQTFLERVRYAYNTIKGGDGFDLGLETAYKAILKDAEKMIKQEKEQITDSYYCGSVQSEWMNAETYYKVTFGEI